MTKESKYFHSICNTNYYSLFSQNRQ